MDSGHEGIVDPIQEIKHYVFKKIDAVRDDILPINFIFKINTKRYKS